MFLLFLCLCIVIKNTFLLFLNLVDWYVNDIFLLSHDILVFMTFIMLLFFLNNAFCITCLCIFFKWFSYILCNYDFLLLIIIFLLIFYIIILLITFSYSVRHNFMIHMNNINFVSSFDDVFDICYYNILFNVIIHMLSDYLFSVF